MKNRIIILLALFLTSCIDEVNDNPLQGKWAGIVGDEYVEFHIAKDTIYPYSYEWGDRIPIRYSVIGDSLIYHTHAFRAKYQVIDNGILIVCNDYLSDTLFRMEKSITTFDEINPIDTNAIYNYALEFISRAESFFVKKGFNNYSEFMWKEINTTEEEEVIIEEWN